LRARSLHSASSPAARKHVLPCGRPRKYTRGPSPIQYHRDRRAVGGLALPGIGTQNRKTSPKPKPSPGNIITPAATPEPLRLWSSCHQFEGLGTERSCPRLAPSAQHLHKARISAMVETMPPLRRVPISSDPRSWMRPPVIAVVWHRLCHQFLLFRIGNEELLSFMPSWISSFSFSIAKRDFPDATPHPARMSVD